MDGIPAEFMPTFDKSKPHGIVTPPEQGAHYEQGGFYFDQDGALVEALLSPADKDRVKRAALQRQADRRADEARNQFLAENGIDANDPDLAKKVIEVAQQASAGADVDVIAWAKGEKAYPFAKVRKAAEAEFNFTATDGRALIAFLVDNQKIKEDEVKVRVN